MQPKADSIIYILWEAQLYKNQKSKRKQQKSFEKMLTVGIFLS